MIDRFGNVLLVSFAAHEDEWLRAAGTLRGQERLEALEQISDMAGRKFASCERRMTLLLVEDREKARLFLKSFAAPSDGLSEGSRRLFVSTPTRTRQQANMPPSALRAVSEAAKMGGSARSVKSAPD